MASFAVDIDVPTFLLERPVLKNLCATIRTAKWQQLGIQLGLDTATLQDINESMPNVEQKRTQMFDAWLKNDPGATNQKIFEALQLKIIGEITMAQDYKEQLKATYVSQGITSY